MEKEIVAITLLLFVSGCTQQTTETEDCTNQLLTVSPLDLEKVVGITPLGNLNPPEHTLPTMHTYWETNEKGLDVVAPGNITITRMMTTKYLADGSEDYGITFKLCQERYGYFLHVKEIIEELEQSTTNPYCHSSDEYEWCSYDLNYEVSAGTVIGKAGEGDHSMLDFGMYDYDINMEHANPERYTTHRPNVICPIEMFEETVKEEIYNKVGRTAEPICGEVMQDVPGTLQGNWFHGQGEADMPDNWEKELALAWDNHEGRKQVISIGGVFTQAGRLMFTPTTSGIVNRYFGTVRDDNVYCYDGEGMNGRILVQLVDENTLLVEHQVGSCEGTFEFENATEYKR
jgi:hypothetical protein